MFALSLDPHDHSAQSGTLHRITREIQLQPRRPNEGHCQFKLFCYTSYRFKLRGEVSPGGSQLLFFSFESQVVLSLPSFVHLI